MCMSPVNHDLRFFFSLDNVFSEANQKEIKKHKARKNE